jgi:hypothetical protein
MVMAMVTRVCCVTKRGPCNDGDNGDKTAKRHARRAHLTRPNVVSGFVVVAVAVVVVSPTTINLGFHGARRSSEHTGPLAAGLPSATKTSVRPSSKTYRYTCNGGALPYSTCVLPMTTDDARRRERPLSNFRNPHYPRSVLNPPCPTTTTIGFFLSSPDQGPEPGLHHPRVSAKPPCHSVRGTTVTGLGEERSSSSRTRALFPAWLR